MLPNNLIKLLRKQAHDIAVDGHCGWGNTMTQAAETIESLTQEIAELDSEILRLQDVMRLSTATNKERRDELQKANERIAEQDSLTLKKIMDEYDSAKDDAGFEWPHPIFQMAEDIDRLNAKVRELESSQSGKVMLDSGVYKSMAEILHEASCDMDDEEFLAFHKFLSSDKTEEVKNV